jgi:hypothetical protein
MYNRVRAITAVDSILKSFLGAWKRSAGAMTASTWCSLSGDQTGRDRNRVSALFLVVIHGTTFVNLTTLVVNLYRFIRELYLCRLTQFGPLA